MRKAVVLLSGGLDSATVLAQAKRDGYLCHAISFAYGQRHATELDAARRVAARIGVAAHQIVPIDLGAFGGSALTDLALTVPEHTAAATGVPITYVPARNTIFLALALGWAEVLGARDLFIGVNAVDYSGYPDCRPAFIAAFETVANLGTRAAMEGEAFRIRAPLVNLSKAEIIRLGLAAGVDYADTVSCYQADRDGRACGRCDSCVLRREGFVQAGVADPTRYR